MFQLVGLVDGWVLVRVLLLLMGSGSRSCCWLWKVVLLGGTGKLVAFCKTHDCQFNDELLKLLLEEVLEEEDELRERV
jgi:hypothetical protein